MCFKMIPLMDVIIFHFSVHLNLYEIKIVKIVIKKIDFNSDICRKCKATTEHRFCYYFKRFTLLFGMFSFWVSMLSKWFAVSENDPLLLLYPALGSLIVADKALKLVMKRGVE